MDARPLGCLPRRTPRPPGLTAPRKENSRAHGHADGDRGHQNHRPESLSGRARRVLRDLQSSPLRRARAFLRFRPGQSVVVGRAGHDPRPAFPEPSGRAGQAGAGAAWVCRDSSSCSARARVGACRSAMPSSRAPRGSRRPISSAPSSSPAGRRRWCSASLFYGHDLIPLLRKASSHCDGATVFAYQVRGPQAYGVVEFDENQTAISIEEKPAAPRSNWAVTRCTSMIPVQSRSPQG